MRRILKTTLLLSMLLPLVGSSTCELKKTSGDGSGFRVAVCTPPSPKCESTPTADPDSSASLEETDDSTSTLLLTSSSAQAALAESFGPEPAARLGFASARAFSLPAAGPAIPEPSGALLFCVGAGLLWRQLRNHGDSRRLDGG